MKVLIQRVNWAEVKVAGDSIGKIGPGMLVFLGVTQDNTEKETDYLVNKIINLRMFENGDKHFDKSLLEINGEVLIVSQFTLYGNCDSGRRPDFIRAAKPELAESLYENFIEKIRAVGIKVEAGKFGADMKVSLENDGPASFIVESRKL